MSSETRHSLPEAPPVPRPPRPDPLSPAPTPAEDDGRSRGSPPTDALGKPRPLTLGLVVVVAAALLAWGARAWEIARTHVESDDAQVEGHIVPVLAHAGGYVLAVHVVENQTVKAGDALVDLDEREQTARLAEAEAQLAVALAGAGENGQAAARLSAARASLVQTRADVTKADADLGRYRSLADRSIVSRQQLDAATSDAASAHARADAAEQQVAAAAADVRAAESRVAAARAARDRAQVELSYATVVAPSDGVVSKKNVEIGQLVQPGQPLLAVVPLTDVWVVANLKETQLERLRAGQKVEIRADSYPRRAWRGHVDSLSPATGAKFSLLPPDNATGNFVKVVQRVPVKILVDDPYDAVQPLRPGMSVRVDISIGS
jgi:membrane fusion protein (multidrug efflux system)